MSTISRRSFLRIVAALGGAAALSATGCSPTAGSSGAASASAGASKPSGALKARFFLMSDVHISSGGDAATVRFAQALADIDALGQRPDGIFVIGDLSDTGYAVEHEIFKQVIEESPFDLQKDFVIAMGNHDYWWAEDASDTAMTQKQKDDFIAAYNLPGLFYDTWVAGQHVVVLGPDVYDTRYSWVQFDLSVQQLNWLDRILADDAAQGIYTYVLCHEPIINTVYGSQEGSWGANNTFVDSDKINAVVSKYPKCVFLTGHTHVYPGVEASDPTRPIFANDGSCGRSYKPGTNVRGSWGLQMLVFDDHLEFNIRDFEEHHWEDDSIIVPLNR